MEAFVFLLFPLAFFSVMIGVFAWTLYFQPKREGEKWARAAAALGLQLEIPNASHRMGLFSSGPTIRQAMWGERGGVPVRVGVRIVVTGGGRNRSTHYYTYAQAAFPRSLEVGLNVSPSNWLAGAFESLMGGHDMQIGHPRLDSDYKIYAAVTDQAQALLLTPYVAESLLALANAPFRPYVCDTEVKVEATGKYFEATALQYALDSAVDLAHRVVSARSSIGPSALQRTLNETWRPVAEATGLALDVDRYAMAGRCEGVHVEVNATQNGEHYSTTFSVHFDRPLGLGLKLERQGALSKLGSLLGMQDIRTGDPTFDDRFVVKGAPEASVRAALTPEVRRMLVALQEQATALEVEDHYLRARVAWLVSEPGWLRAGITSIARAGAVLSGVTSNAVGPYRV